MTPRHEDEGEPLRLHPAELIDAHVWWQMGASTYEIWNTHHIGASEAAVYNSLSAYRDQLWKAAHGETDRKGLEEAKIHQPVQGLLHPADPTLDDGRAPGPSESESLGQAHCRHAAKAGDR